MGRFLVSIIYDAEYYVDCCRAASLRPRRGLSFAPVRRWARLGPRPRVAAGASPLRVAAPHILQSDTASIYA